MPGSKEAPCCIIVCVQGDQKIYIKYRKKSSGFIEVDVVSALNGMAWAPWRAQEGILPWPGLLSSYPHPVLFPGNITCWSEQMPAASPRRLCWHQAALLLSWFCLFLSMGKGKCAEGALTGLPFPSLDSLILQQLLALKLRVGFNYSQFLRQGH